MRGLRDRGKRAFFAFLRGLDFDVCLLQEVHLRDGEDVKGFVKGWGWGESRWGVGGGSLHGGGGFI